MELAFIPVLLIGLVLGGLCMWLYSRLNLAKIKITTEEYNKSSVELAAVNTQLAITLNDRENTRASLMDAKKDIAILTESYQIASRDLAVMETENAHADTSLRELAGENKVFKDELLQKFNMLIAADNTIARLTQELKGKDDRHKTQKEDFDQIKGKLETEFRAIAGTILDTSSQKLTQQQTDKLTDLLKPFREQIEGFKKDIDTKFTHEASEKGSLKQQIESLVNLNHSIAREALALTEALRGSTKKQGDWGEDILERILEYSGLQKDVQYFVQQQSQNDEGKTIRPDIIVRYPDTRYLVIDAKVSLTHYWDFCNAATPADQKELLPRIVGSLKQHIDGLSAKRYTDVAGTPDFIIMFMPVEAAYITAMQHEHTLWQYAYDKKILLISPTNLLPAMKMVSIMWDKDAVNRDGELIVKKAVGLYEKFHTFITTFESVGADMERAQKRWNEARGQLHTGRDNLIAQGSKLKQLLGKKTAKDLPAPLVDIALLEEDIIPITE